MIECRLEVVENGINDEDDGWIMGNTVVHITYGTRTTQLTNSAIRETKELFTQMLTNTLNNASYQFNVIKMQSPTSPKGKQCGKSKWKPFTISNSLCTFDTLVARFYR